MQFYINIIYKNIVYTIQTERISSGLLQSGVKGWRLIIGDSHFLHHTCLKH